MAETTNLASDKNKLIVMVRGPFVNGVHKIFKTCHFPSPVRIWEMTTWTKYTHPPYVIKLHTQYLFNNLLR